MATLKKLCRVEVPDITIDNPPVNPTDGVNKAYVDALIVAQNCSPHLHIDMGTFLVPNACIDGGGFI